jgi:dipeptidyl aminopeptidase/acylaminoacyl peptidase
MVLGETRTNSTTARRSRISNGSGQGLLIVGGADERVPAVQGERLHEALTMRKVDHEWLYQRTEGHGFYAEPHLVQMYERVLALLDPQIGGKPATTEQAP